MKIALAQINTTVGDFDRQLERMTTSLDRARSEGVDLVVFPEQTIPGYPAEDLLEREDFLAAIESTFARALEACRGIAMVVGTVSRASGPGKPIYNSAVLVVDGEVRHTQHKSLLPTYDVFDEARYFRPAHEYSVVEFGGRKIGLVVCEDLWNDPEFWSDQRYTCDPVEDLCGRGGADLLVAVSASPFSIGRLSFRHEMLRSTAVRRGVDIAYCNLVGGNTSLVFDGGSFAIDRNGGLLAEARSFEEDFVTFELPMEGAAKGVQPPPADAETASADVGRQSSSGRDCYSDRDCEEVFSALVLGTRDYLAKTGFQSAVLGLSGGIDSALTAAVAVEALGRDKVRGLAMPSRYSSEGSVSDAVQLAKNLDIQIDEVAIESIFGSTLSTLDPLFSGLEADVTEENLQARIRGLLLMALSNKTGAILLTTGNKSELSVGYCTLYGDMSGGLAVISDVPKLLVYALCRWLNREREVVPWATIDKPPSAELRPDQKDEDSLPPYEILDPILELYVEEQRSLDEIVALGFDRDTVRRVLWLVDLNEYKRKQAAPGLRVTPKAFGGGRRLPIVQRFRRS
ncbi:MAG: NAD+ synthase [Planctomycetota bacterium]